MLFRLEQEASLKSLGRMQDELYRWIKGYENALISVYNDSEIMEALTSDHAKDGGMVKGARAVYGLMQSTFEPAQSVSALYLYTMDRRLVGSSRIASTPRYNFPEDIFLDPKANRAEEVASYASSDNRVMLISSVYNPSRQQTLLRFVLKLYTNNVKTKIGFIVCDIDLKAFARIVAKYTYTDHQLVWLQPWGGHAILVYGSPVGVAGAAYQRITTEIQAGTWKDPQLRKVGNQVFLASPQQKYDLTAYSLVPQAFLEESQSVLLRNLVIIALLLVGVVLVSVPLVTRSLTTPLTQIVGRLGQIELGRTDLRLENLKADEIGVLGHGINRMLDRIQDLIAEEYVTELQLRSAEYKALQAQVNPHFLYNTLETMAAIAMTEDGPLVAELCRATSRLFRYSLNMKDPLSTLGEEIEHLRNYLYVMNVRTRGSLEVEIDLPTELLPVRVPRLSLQPLVENSIQHGLKQKRGAKKVRIGAESRGGKVTVAVEDNGVGMDPEPVNRQLRENPFGVTEKNASIGIGNIHARVTQLFGRDFGVRVESRIGEGTTVRIEVPWAESDGRIP